MIPVAWGCCNAYRFISFFLLFFNTYEIMFSFYCLVCYLFS